MATIDAVALTTPAAANRLMVLPQVISHLPTARACLHVERLQATASCLWCLALGATFERVVTCERLVAMQQGRWHELDLGGSVLHTDQHRQLLLPSLSPFL